MNKLHIDTKVSTEYNGIKSLDELKIGDRILCIENNIDAYCEVTEIVESGEYLSKNIFANGSYLRCSNDTEISKHIEDNILYAVSPSKKDSLLKFNNNLSDIGWFIGTHIGDGTTDKKLYKTNKEEYYKYRMRINGDNENVIIKYKNIANDLTESCCVHSIDSDKNYRSLVWCYGVCNRKVRDVVENLFDDKTGSKTYSGEVPTYIKENNLWIPFISGLIDSDGAIKENGSIDISMCMTKMIEMVCSVLSINGSRYKYTLKTSVRINEKPLNRMIIYLNDSICKDIVKYMEHEIKISKINEGNSNKFYSPVLIKIPEEIFNRIIKTKILEQGSSEYRNAHAIKSIMRKNKNSEIGLASLLLFNKLGIITDVEKDYTLRQQKLLKNIKENEEQQKTLSIKTTTGNFYAGEFGMVNIHE